MFRKLALAAASALVSLALLELALRVTGLELHDRLNDGRKYGSLLALDEAGDYFRHPAGTSVRHFQRLEVESIRGLANQSIRHCAMARTTFRLAAASEITSGRSASCLCRSADLSISRALHV